MKLEMYDVAVVGYGPVGMAMAALLGRSGHSVIVLERYAGKYNLPRAAIFDDETMRTFARLGIAESLLPKLHVQKNYEWRNAAGQLLIEHDFATEGRSGWAEWYMMYQPDLEDALDATCVAAGVEVRFDSPVTAIEQDARSVRLKVGDSDETVKARYVVACDGGNSFVRQALDIPLENFGFSEPWMVCDFRFKQKVALPTARQVCDPAQPISIISLGPDHHRFSFMLDSEDVAERERQPERVWGRVSKFISPDQAELIRAATYTFRSLVAEDWRKGRIVLAGDSAHQMPPFLGQGMCSGIRDAVNLAFKFDLILAGKASDQILDTYQTERDEHVRAVVIKGIELGKVQTMRDPAAAERRDAALLAKKAANDKPEKIRFPPLGNGLFGVGEGSRELFIQGRVASNGATERFDAVFGYGYFVLIKAGLREQLDDAVLDRAAASGLKVVFIDQHDDAAPHHANDVDGAYTQWLKDHASDAVAVRPDMYVWGSAAGATDVQQMIAQFADLAGGQAAPTSALKGVA